MELILTNVPHNLNPCIGWLRLHIHSGTAPSPEQMQAMVDKMYAAIQAVEDFSENA